jgi:uracil-DNA glycosylase
VKISECKKCGLAKSRLHTSTNLGAKRAEVLVVFGKEPYTRRNILQMKEFIRSLDSILEGDWAVTFAIRCMVKAPVDLKSVKACRLWLNKTIARVDPYLVILMGELSVKAVLGLKYREIPEDAFYNKKGKTRSRKYYVGPKLGCSNDKLAFTTSKLLAYIRSAYG